MTFPFVVTGSALAYTRSVFAPDDVLADKRMTFRTDVCAMGNSGKTVTTKDVFTMCDRFQMIRIHTITLAA